MYNKKMEKLHLDLDGDGSVTWDEYMQATYNTHGGWIDGGARVMMVLTLSTFRS